MAQGDARQCGPLAPSALGAQAIATVDGGYRLELGDDQIDVRRFERLVAEAERLAAVGEPERAALRLAEALQLVVGEPFADLDGWEPGVAAAARVAELVRRAEEQLVAAWLAAGQYQEALRAASEQVVREPLREQRWAALALAQYRAGRQGEALRTIQRARRVLADELGLDPGAGAGRVGTGDPRPGAASDRPGAGGGLVGWGLPVSRVGRLRPR